MSLSLLLLELLLLLLLELLLLLVRVFPLSRPGHLDLQQAGLEETCEATPGAAGCRVNPAV